MIRIVNLRNYKLSEGEVLIKVDRSSPVGNKFYMKNELERDNVCNLYDDWFINANHTKDFYDYINNIINTAKKHDVALGCWCYPKRCHAETIRKFCEQLSYDFDVDAIANQDICDSEYEGRYLGEC